MKKLVLLITFLFLTTSVQAGNYPPLKYHNIGINKKISHDSETGKWAYGIDKVSGNYFKKVKGDGAYNYINANKDYVFSTNCDYEFIKDGDFICYSNSDLNFSKINFSNNIISKTPLTEEEISAILKSYKIIKISEFSKNTNAYKMRKEFGSKNICILNDTDNKYDDYTFTSGNAKFNKFLLNGFIRVKTAGMFEFSSKNPTSPDLPWYVILVR